MSYQVINPFVQFVDPATGRPLSGGSVYFGRMDTDPKNQPANRLNVYAVQDNGSEVLLAQPITLNGAGQPQYNGSVKQVKVELYTGESAFSVQVFNSSGAQKGYTSRLYAPLDISTGVSKEELASLTSDVLIAGVKAKDLVILKFVSCVMYGGDKTGATDSSAAIQSAVNYAIANNVPYRDPAGTFLVNSTVTMGRMSFRGAGAGSTGGATTYVAGVTGGAPVFNFPSGTNFFDFRDFRIASTFNRAGFLTGANNAQDCIGIRVQSTSPSPFSARFTFKDVVVYGVKTAWDVYGFIGDMNNCWALASETGFAMNEVNASTFKLRCEECRKDFSIVKSGGIVFDNFLSEGASLQFGLTQSTIDNCQGITFVSPYFEQSRNTSFIKVGFTTICHSIGFSDLRLAASDATGSDYNASLLEFDNVDGLFISGYFSTGSHHNRYTTTTNTKNIIDNSTSPNANYFAPHDNSKALSQCFNHFPNHDFSLWLKGWPSITITRATVAQETSIVRRGANALRLTYTAAQTAAASIRFNLNDTPLEPTVLRGRSVSMYAWVWIPDTADFNSNDQNLQKIQPFIQITTTGTGGASYASGTANTMRGQWNLFKVSGSVPTDCTAIELAVFMSVGTGSTTGAEFVIVDSIYLVEGALSNTINIINGSVQNAPTISATAMGGKLTQWCTTPPTDADMTYAVGDSFRTLSVTAGGFIGTVVTTAGTGATMVTKGFGSIQP